MSTKKATSSVSAAPGGEGSSGSDSDSATQSEGAGHRDSSRKPGRIRWTAEMDVRLTEGVKQHKAQSWTRVAEFMGDGLSSKQCMNRWISSLGPQQRGIKESNWQPDEEKLLLEVVPQHLISSYWSDQYKVMTQDRTDWKAIGRELGRSALNCKSKYKLIQYSHKKQGRFTAEEDALICQRVKEWGDKGKGLWVALEKEMGRADVQISKRWRLTLSKRQ